MHFSLATYEEYKGVLKGCLITKVLKYKEEHSKLVEKKSMSVLNYAGKQQYRINCYQTPSNVMVNSRYLLHFITEIMPDIMDILRHNKHFTEMNHKIRNACDDYTNS